MTTTTTTTTIENDQIKALAKQQNEYMRRRFSTKYSAYNYKVEQTRILHNVTYGLMWVYFILAAFYLGILFVSPSQQNYGIYYKMAILLVLVLYPFLITPLEYFVFRAITFVIETIVGNVFTRDDHEYVVEHTYLPGFFSY